MGKAVYSLYMDQAGSFLFALHVNMQAVAHTDRAEQPKFSLRGEKEEGGGWTLM